MTGREANPSDVEQLIETGESERIFQRAIMEQGRGQVPSSPTLLPALPSAFSVAPSDLHVRKGKFSSALLVSGTSALIQAMLCLRMFSS